VVKVVLAAGGKMEGRQYINDEGTSLEEVQHKAEEIDPFCSGLDHKLTLPPAQFHRVISEARFSIQIAPLLGLIPSTKHERCHLTHAAEVGELAVR
jgi:hypothetical protein